MDPALVIRAKAADEDAFTRLAMDVGGRLNRIAFSILRDRGLAQDATQQALIDMWRNLESLRDPARFEAWAYRIVVRACYAEARRARRSLPQLFEQYADVATDAVGVVHDRDQLERAFRRLSLDQRAVVVLHHYVGMPLPEVARTLGIREGTAHSRLGRAMDELRRALTADEPAPRHVTQEAPG